MSEVMRIPIIRLYDNLIVSVQVSLSDNLVMQLKDDITEAVERTNAQGLVIVRRLWPDKTRSRSIGISC